MPQDLHFYGWSWSCHFKIRGSFYGDYITHTKTSLTNVYLYSPMMVVKGLIWYIFLDKQKGERRCTLQCRLETTSVTWNIYSLNGSSFKLLIFYYIAVCLYRPFVSLVYAYSHFLWHLKLFSLWTSFKMVFYHSWYFYLCSWLFIPENNLHAAQKLR